MRKLRIHCFQQVEIEGLGCIADWIKKNGHELSYTRFYEGMALPEMDVLDCLVVLGGPMSVYEEDKYPWLADEKRFIRKAIDEDKAVLGICLGAQLIAAALGAKVYSGRQKEIGWFNLNLTAAGQSSVLCSLVDTKVFHWHGDIFDVPEGADLIAFSDATPHQAFLYKKKVLALQFHLEVNAQSVENMVDSFIKELVPSKFVQCADDILSQNEHIPANNRMMFNILDDFFCA